MAGQRFFEKLALLNKLETTYGTDATPTGAADALLATNVTITPLAGTEVSRDLLLPYFGNQGIVLAGIYASIQFDIELAGSGTPGSAPAYGSCIRASGFSETLLATTSASYKPVSGNFESTTLYYNADGVKHILLGCRGTFSMSMAPKGIPKLTFTLTGLLGTITDAALPTVDLTKFQVPLAVSKAATTMSLHGWSAVAESLSLDMGNVITPRFLIGDESIQLSDRSISGTTVVEARSIATVDWFGKAKSRARGVLNVVHGTAAGNIVTLNAPAVEIGRPTQGQTDKIINYSLPLGLCPSVGNDELSIVFT